MPRSMAKAAIAKNTTMHSATMAIVMPFSGSRRLLLMALLTSFWLAIEFVGFKELLGKLLQSGNGVGRRDLACGHQDHELVVGLIQVLALEECPKDGNVTQAGNLGAGIGETVVHQSGDHEALAIFDLEFGLGAPGAERRYHKAGDGEAVGKVERADLGIHPQMDVAVRHDDRS